jgi:hypothetical protein
MDFWRRHNRAFFLKMLKFLREDKRKAKVSSPFRSNNMTSILFSNDKNRLLKTQGCVDVCLGGDCRWGKRGYPLLGMTAVSRV